MCSIFGALVWNQSNDEANLETNRFLETMYRMAHLRGRDGRGYSVNSKRGRYEQREPSHVDDQMLGEPTVVFGSGVNVLIGNTRAEPTTEFVKHKHDYDQQPYGTGDWQIVHNGTIANDKALRIRAAEFINPQHAMSTHIDSAAIVETLEYYSGREKDAFEAFFMTVKDLKGSFAILATTERENEIYVACNYRPIWYVTTWFGVFFGSTREAFPDDYVPQMVQPYSVMYFHQPSEKGQLQVHKRLLNPPTIDSHRALVVCSGGLDSVVSACHAKYILGHQIELIHFVYGSRAQGPEVQAIEDVAKWLDVPLHFKAIPNVWDTEDSNLLNPDSGIAGGEAGAEFAHEWVPARNLVMLAVATAFAEAKGFEYIVLGNNLEEAGAYPDNEPEFIDRFNDLLPFAVGDGKKVTVVMPVGNMMKHEIVKLGTEIGAPLHLTWSCYRAGKMHCGKCGPCFMRRTAFKINNLPEVIEYEL